MVERFFDHYGALEESNESDATAYPGVTETLRILHDAGMSIAVVTNKQSRFASGLLHRLNLATCIDVVVGGDTCERRQARSAAVAVCLRIAGDPARRGVDGRRFRQRCERRTRGRYPDRLCSLWV